jgi:uncharacterized protein YcbK (DUF882 family)
MMVPAEAFSLPLLPQERSLVFYNIHTGEHLTATYWSQGRYVPDAMGDIDHLLRDYRTGEVKTIDRGLYDLLYRVSSVLNSSQPFHVISGYRSPATNAALAEKSHRVSSRSLHMEGMAIDVYLPDRSLAELHHVALSLRAGGVGYYPESNFVHIDVGRVRTW